MKIGMKIGTTIAAAALLACAATPALAQADAAIGLGGAKEQMLPTAVGADRWLDDQTFRASQPLMHAIQAQPGIWVEAPPIAPLYAPLPYARPY